MKSRVRKFDDLEVDRIIVEERRAGRDYAAIADVVRQRTGKRYAPASLARRFSARLRELRETYRDELADYVQIMLARYEELYANALPHALTRYDAQGNVTGLPDPAQQEVCLKVLDRIARLLGLERSPSVHVTQEGGVWNFVRLVQSGADVTQRAQTIEESLGLPPPEIHIETRDDDEQDEQDE